MCLLPKQGGVRNPIVSSALFLTSRVGGPTLVTDQSISAGGLAERGWATLPHANRLLMFDGRHLHGVIPGRGVAPAQSGTPSRRISLMVAFWPSIRERFSPEPVAARPFPYADASETRDWTLLFDWPTADDDCAGGEGSATQVEGEAGPVWCVEPVWQRVDGKADGAMREMLPAYERCFQGF